MSDIKVGDYVTHIEDFWDTPLKVKKIVNGPGPEKYARFEPSGIWALSRLKKVAPPVRQVKEQEG